MGALTARAWAVLILGSCFLGLACGVLQYAKLEALAHQRDVAAPGAPAARPDPLLARPFGNTCASGKCPAECCSAGTRDTCCCLSPAHECKCIWPPAPVAPDHGG